MRRFPWEMAVWSWLKKGVGIGRDGVGHGRGWERGLEGGVYCAVFLRNT